MRAVGGLFLGLLMAAPGVATASTIPLRLLGPDSPQVSSGDALTAVGESIGLTFRRSGDESGFEPLASVGRGISYVRLPELNGGDNLFVGTSARLVDFGRGLQEQSGSVSGNEGAFLLSEQVETPSVDLDWARIFAVGAPASVRTPVNNEVRVSDATESSATRGASARQTSSVPDGTEGAAARAVREPANAEFLSGGPQGVNLSFDFGTPGALSESPSSLSLWESYAGSFAAMSPVPEPASLLFLGTGLLGLARSVRRRRRAQLPVPTTSLG